MAITAQARALREAGVPVISLSIGEPDLATPAHATQAGIAAALAGETKYPPLDGTKALKAAIQRKFARDAGLDVAPDEIAVGNGAKQVIINALMATIDPGDEVVIPAPYWGAYPLMAGLAGGTPVSVPCPQADGFRPRPAALEAAITPRTRWVILNFPNNPSGATLSRPELAALAEVLLRHPHVWILSDEIYEHLLFDGDRVGLVAVEPRLRDRTLVVNGVSKTYAMTGWRVGFGVGPRDLIRAVVNLQGQATSGVSGIAQAAAAAALDGPQDAVAAMRDAYRRRRDLVLDLLARAPGLACHRPDGAFYAYPDISGCLGRSTQGGQRLDTDADFAAALLRDAHVAVVPGAAFGLSPHIRISTAADDATLREACGRIAGFCAALR